MNDDRVKIDLEVGAKDNTKATTNNIEKEIDNMQKSARSYAEALNIISARLEKLKHLSKNIFRDASNVSKKDLDVVTDAIDELGEELNKLRNSANKDESLLGNAKSKTLNDIERIIKEYDRLNAKIAESEKISRKLGGIKENKPSASSKENLSKYTNARKHAWNTIGTYASKMTNTSWNLFKKAGRGALRVLEGSFRGLAKASGAIWNIFQRKGNSTISQIGSQLKTLLGYFSLYKLVDTGKDAIKFTSDMIEVRNVVNSVFRESSKDIEDFAKSAISSFGLTQLQANKFAGSFGGMLEASNIVGENAKVMSKNLTALAGDIASFYNLGVQESYEKLASGLAGQSKALRSLGVNMNVVNLEAYAMAHGIDASWESLDVATQQMIRYNYIMETLSTAQGDFARTSGTWANQIRLLSSNWEQLLSIMGGVLIQVFYPMVQVLNQIVSLAIQGAKALANMFGFDYESLEDQFGTGANLDLGGISEPEVDTSALEDYADASEDATKATDDLGKATKDAGDNLQSFDKLNNITTDSLDKQNKALKDSKKGKKSDLKKNFNIKPYDYLKNQKSPAIVVNEWLDDWIKTLQDKRWREAGVKLADKIGEGLDKVYGKLTDDKFKKGVKNTATGIGEFINGLSQDADLFQKTGQTLGAGVNTVTHFLNTLFTQIDWHNMGVNFNAGFKSFLTELDAKALGESLANKFYALIEIMSGMLEDGSTWDLLGTKITGGIDSFFKRVDLAKSIPTVLGFGGRLVSSLATGVINADWSTIGNSISTGFNTAINNLDENKLGSMLSGLIDTIATLFNSLGDIDTEQLGTKIGDSLNTAISDGSVRKLASSATKLAGAIGEFFVSVAKTVDWGKFIKELFAGIKDGFSKLKPDEQTGLKLFAALGIGVGIFKAGKGLAHLARDFNDIKAFFGGKRSESLGEEIAEGVFRGASKRTKGLMPKLAETLRDTSTDIGAKRTKGLMPKLADMLKVKGADIGAKGIGKLIFKDLKLAAFWEFIWEMLKDLGNRTVVNFEDTVEKSHLRNAQLRTKKKGFKKDNSKVDLGLAKDTDIDNIMSYSRAVEDLVEKYNNLDTAVKTLDTGWKSSYTNMANAKLSNEEYMNQVREFDGVLRQYGFTASDAYQKLQELLSQDTSKFTGSDWEEYREKVNTALYAVQTDIETTYSALKSNLEAGNDELATKVDEYFSNVNGLGDATVNSVSSATTQALSTLDSSVNQYVSDFRRKIQELEDIANKTKLPNAPKGWYNAPLGSFGKKPYGTRVSGGFSPQIRSSSDTGARFAPRGFMAVNPSDYSTASMYASTLPKVQGIATLGLSNNTPLGGISNYVRDIVPPRQAEVIGSIKTASTDDALLVNKMNSILSKLNSMRTVGGNGQPNVDLSIRIGNKEIDNFIVDSVRRNKYRLG